jgi:3-oxoacyl-[acyl-carrier protein] reductase
MQALTGKGALVTGGSRGIGRAIVQRLARDGATVTFSYQRDVDAAESLISEIAAQGGSAFAVRSDLALGHEITALFDVAQQNAPTLDIVVNNAAVGAADLMGPIAEATDDEYDAMMDVNAKGTFRAMREAARRVADNGRIINISSTSTVTRVAGVALYAASKAVVEQLAVVCAYELAPRGITVNAVLPGATDTDMLRSAFDDEIVAGIAASSPMGRIGTPDDIADVVAFLAGPGGRWVTGQVLQVTGQPA